MKDDILLFSFFVAVLCFAIGIVALSIKQIIDLRHQAELRHKMRCLRRPKQPWVTVVVDAIGKSDVATALTLKSLNKVHYYNYDILVVKGAGLTKKQSAQALKLGYSKSRRGTVVIVLDAGEVVDEALIKRAVASQNKQAAWRVAVYEKIETGSGPQLMDVIRMLEKDYWQLVRPTKVFTSDGFITGDGKPKSTLRYNSHFRDTIAVMLFATIILAAFAVGELRLIFGAWLLVTAYGLGVIWLSCYQNIKTKLVLVFSASLSTFLFPVVGVMRLFSRSTLTK